MEEEVSTERDCNCEQARELQRRVAELEARLSAAERRATPITCHEPGCSTAATYTDEAPARTATSNDWWCDEHVGLHIPEPGWERDRCDWNRHWDAALLQIAALKARLDPANPENVERVAEAIAGGDLDPQDLSEQSAIWEVRRERARAVLTALVGGG